MPVVISTTPNRGATNTARVNFISVILVLLLGAIGLGITAASGNVAGIIVGLIVGGLLALSPKMASQWERAVVLRLGRFQGLRGPGLFFLMPLVERVSFWVDQRVITTSFAAEETLTLDTVPVNVDAVLFWKVHDTEKAALEVQD